MKSLTKVELDIFRYLVDKEMTVTQLSGKLNKPISWISNVLNNLKEKDFLNDERIGYRKIWRANDKKFVQSFRKLIREEKMMNLDVLLTNSKLKILPLLVEPGYTVNEIMERTSISMTVLYEYLRLWKGSGIVHKKNNKYIINPKQKYLAEFLIEYQKHINYQFLNERCPEGIILWQWRDEFLFSTENPIDNDIYCKAAYSRLDELGYPLEHQNEYYMFTPVRHDISDEEAIIQSIMIDENNPRIREIIKDSLKLGNINKELINKYREKYFTWGILGEIH